jgi:hypothetical protein
MEFFFRLSIFLIDNQGRDTGPSILANRISTLLGDVVTGFGSKELAMKAKPAFGTVALFQLGVIRACSLVGTERETLQVLTGFSVVADLGRLELKRGSSIEGLVVKCRRALASVFGFSVHFHGITASSIETVEATIISTRFAFIGKVILFIVDLLPL